MMEQSWKSIVSFRFKCNVFKAMVRGDLLSGLCAFAGQSGSFTEGELSQLEACQNKLARLWHREELGTKSPRRGKFRQRNCPSLPMELRIHRLGWAKKIAEQTQRNDLAHQQVLAAIFGQTRLDRHPGVTDDGILTFCATPRAKQFQNGTKSVKELEGVDDFVRGVKGDLRKVFWMYADDLSAIDLNVIGAKYWGTWWPPPGTKQRSCRKAHKTYQCRCGTEDGKRCGDFFETNRARVAHEVHAQSLEGTHGLKLYVTTMTTSNVCSFAKQYFSNLATARVHVVQAFRYGRRSVNRSAPAYYWEERAQAEPPFFCAPTLTARLFTVRCFFCVWHVKHKHLSKWSTQSQVHKRQQHEHEDSSGTEAI